VNDNVREISIGGENYERKYSSPPFRYLQDFERHRVKCKSG
jgi:hypothetical protein